jgi:iron(III) transport system substrate-binding protein
MKSIRSFILLAILSSLLLACGSEAATSTSQTAANPTTASAPTATTLAAATAQPDPEIEVSPTVPEGASFTPVEGSLVIYSGRSETLVGPLVEMFEKDTGIEAQVRYGDTAELAAQLLEEGDNSPADVFFAQDAGALGALNDRFITLEDEILDKVEPRFRSDNSTWVGISGRARVLVYNTDALKESDLPASILELTDPKWKGRLGWAPTNASLQAFVTALRLTKGEDVAKQWLEGMVANEPKSYDKNGAIVQAVANGEIDAGLVNHYYLFALKKDKGDVKAANYYFPNGDLGSLVNVAGVGTLKTGKNQAAAEAFIEYLLSDKAQQYFTDETFEYPLVSGIKTNPAIKPLAEINSPALDLSDLKDLQGTLTLLQDVGALK